MKWIKLFESFESESIESICREYGIRNWTINEDGSVDVDGDVDISELELEKIPLKFGKVSGDFHCYTNLLISLEGAPKVVGGNFDCSFNKLTSLEGGPIEVGHSFYCYNNNLTSLKGSPEVVGGDFSCSFNKLTSLEGGPKEVGGSFNCQRNKLITLEGGPNKVGGSFLCQGNPISFVYKLFPDHKAYLDSLDYDYLRGTSIIKWKFKEALDEIGGEMPESILGWKYI
jgi:hypothetical protein